MDKSIMCYKIHIKHDGRIGEMIFRAQMETEKAYEIIATKICNEITGATIKLDIDGEVITKELTPEDIKDMWIEDITS